MFEMVTDHSIKRLSSIVAHVAARHKIDRDIALTDNLVDSGMTSIAMVDLMLAVEAEFDLMIPQREMTSSNFCSIKALAGLLQRLDGDH